MIIPFKKLISIIIRSYTPVTGDETPGKVSFVIKVYKAGVHPKFPEGGKMSQHLNSLNVGDTIEMKGPKGHLTYLSKGKFTVKLMRKPLETRKAKHFGAFDFVLCLCFVVFLFLVFFTDLRSFFTNHQTNSCSISQFQLISFHSFHGSFFHYYFHFHFAIKLALHPKL